ncbi:hypothetical protein TrST_g171 [Triparma strigata]|uniref:Heterogeneous nuclear ribonucleoprotein Q acidic domain-containing protein n=1 Tax=Triparma strigata TaxID=1606541 RepID=A0A9W7BLI1_9STRA|nr:hypothetical protein TrST_g171 [Triparma strigata]
MMDYTKFKVADLKALCGSRGLGFSSKSKKAELVGALVMFDAKEAQDEESKKQQQKKRLSDSAGDRVENPNEAKSHPNNSNRAPPPPPPPPPPPLPIEQVRANFLASGLHPKQTGGQIPRNFRRQQMEQSRYGPGQQAPGPNAHLSHKFNDAQAKNRLNPGLQFPPFIRADLSIINNSIADYLNKLPLELQNEALRDFQADIDARVSIKSYQGYLIGIIKRFIRDGRGGPKALRDKVDQRDQSINPNLLPYHLRTMQNGLSDKTCRHLDDLFASGFCARREFDQRVFERLKELTENQACCAIVELQQVSPEKKATIRNIGGYLMGIVNNYKNGGRDHVINPQTGELTGAPVGPLRHNRPNPYLAGQNQPVHVPPTHQTPSPTKATWEEQMARLGNTQSSPVLGSRSQPAAAPPVQTLGQPQMPQMPQMQPMQYSHAPHQPPHNLPPPSFPPSLNRPVNQLGPRPTQGKLGEPEDLTTIAANASAALAFLNKTPLAQRTNPPQHFNTPTIEALPLVVQYALNALEKKTGLDPKTLPPPILHLMSQIPPNNAAKALQEFADMDLAAAGNKSALLMGVLNRAGKRS